MCLLWLSAEGACMNGPGRGTDRGTRRRQVVCGLAGAYNLEIIPQADPE
ncbi:conserved hypothetical protein [delta proteobacterium NaphS2]|nr:conserved hypothetical protein [delta proteobacterium NaphS2]